MHTPPHTEIGQQESCRNTCSSQKESSCLMVAIPVNATTSRPPPPVNIAVTELIPEISHCKTIKEVKQIHAKLIKTGQVNDPLLCAELLRFSSLSGYRDLKYARSVFSHMDHPNCFSYNTMIRSLAESVNSKDDLFDALAIFTVMLCDEFVSPNRFTFPSVLKACTQARNSVVGKQVHAHVVKLGLEDDDFIASNLLRMYAMSGVMDYAHLFFNRRINCSKDCDIEGLVDEVMNVPGHSKTREEGNVVLWNIMVDGYIRLGKLKAARNLFDRMPQRTVVSWNGMIAGYVEHGHYKDAVLLFREMQLIKENVRPNYVTLVSILPAISSLGALELGKWVHLYAEKNHIKIDDVLGSALVDMYSKCGSIDKALQLFGNLPKKSAITWNVIVGGLAIHGLAEEAINYFSMMEEAGVKPTDVTYISILTACSHAGLVDKGKSFFSQMINAAGLRPRIEHYGCMVDLLGRNGLLKEAEEIIRIMPMEPDDVIWKALLGACKMHGDIEMGEIVAKQLMDMTPRDSGSYVALSNMHASLGNWEEVAQVRLLMKNRDIRKDPGCSWIEIDGMIHEFLVEDDTHPHAKGIHLMLEEISQQLRTMGYRSNTTQVLLNMDEDEKGSTLNYHSEKIAIAYGLISTSSQTPLRVVKNLRICDDCHSTMKLISKIYKRRIVVRDRKRFHHFEDGSCSCRDHW